MKIDHNLSFDTKNKEFERACKIHGLALTIQRRAILESLASRTDHPTADQVYDDIKEKLKGVSRTTVYRVLDILVSIGVAKKISNPDSTSRFDADTSRHHHLTCLKCGLVLDLHDEDFNNLQHPTGFESEFQIMDYSITFTGFCARCSRPESEPEI